MNKLLNFFKIIFFSNLKNKKNSLNKHSKDVRLPVQLQRAMAAEAEAAREARAKVIAAEGEQKASKALREASEVIGDSPAALQLRYLQVFNTPPPKITQRKFIILRVFFRFSCLDVKRNIS